MSQQISRRAALQAAAIGAAGLTATLAGCSSTAAPVGTSTASAANTVAPDPPGSRILVAFFSRAGENYYYGGRTNLAVGNTEVVAGMIRDRIGAELYKIEPVDRYPDSYDEAVDRNSEEQESNALPAIAGALPDLGPYDVVILGSPYGAAGRPGSCRPSSRA